MSTLIFSTPRLASPRLMTGTVLGSVFGLASLLYLSNVPIHGGSYPHRVGIGTALILSDSYHPFSEPAKTVAKHALPPAARKSSYAIKDFKNLALHPDRKEYTYTFTGKILCGDSPCQRAVVQVNVETLANRGLEKVVLIQPDGSYSIKFVLQEVPHEQIDWRIMARTPDTNGSELHGRQILMDESAVTIDSPLQI